MLKIIESKSMVKIKSKLILKFGISKFTLLIEKKTKKHNTFCPD